MTKEDIDEFRNLVLVLTLEIFHRQNISVLNHFGSL